MSIERHPNINMAGVAVELYCAIREHIRDPEMRSLEFEGLESKIEQFLAEVEDVVDKSIWKKTGKCPACGQTRTTPCGPATGECWIDWAELEDQPREV